jgi:hypothetical protein
MHICLDFFSLFLRSGDKRSSHPHTDINIMEPTNRAQSKEKSNSPGFDREHLHPLGGGFIMVDHCLQEHLICDLSELSRQQLRPHSRQVKQEAEEFDCIFPDDEMAASILVKIKEENFDQKFLLGVDNAVYSPIRIKEEEIDQEPPEWVKLPASQGMIKEEEIDQKPPECLKLPSSPGRFKEELWAEDDEDAKSKIKLKTKLNHEEDSDSLGSYQGNPIKVQDTPRIRGPWARSIVALSSPYCRVMRKPSWETTRVYHK